MQNDPVNFVDPSGLCGYVITWTNNANGSRTITSTTSTPCFTNSTNGQSGGGTGGGGGGLFGDVLIAIELGGDMDSPGGGGGVPARTPIPQETADVQRRLAEGRAWDRWQAWINCNTPIMNKYNAQLHEFHRIGGTAFSREVGAGFAVFTAGVGAGHVSQFDPLPAGGGPVIGVLSAVLIVWGEINWARATVNKIMSDYKAESEQTCGSKPSPPPGVR